jgi:hypothetical protein
MGGHPLKSGVTGKILRGQRFGLVAVGWPRARGAMKRRTGRGGAGGPAPKNSAAFGRWLATSAAHSRVFSTALASVYGPPGDAWDVASACLFEACGIQAVGTTSAGTARF